MSDETLPRAVALGFDDYDPGVVIAAVNALVPQGKDAALASIEAAAGDGDAIGLFWVLRTLFDLPPGQVHPEVRWGLPDVSPPVDPTTLPRFPLVLAAGVPILAVHGYTLAGLPEPASAHIATYRADGILREGPVVLPEDLGNVAEDFLAQWRRAYNAAGEPAPRELVTAQLALLRG